MGRAVKKTENPKPIAKAAPRITLSESATKSGGTVSIHEYLGGPEIAKTHVEAFDSAASIAKRIGAQMNPAIAGARKEGAVVVLGYDDPIAGVAELARSRHEEIEKYERELKPLADEMRAYAMTSRAAWNDAKKDDAVTVRIPSGEASSVLVTCANKYSVKQDAVLAKRDALGVFFDQAFDIVTAKTLRPNAVPLLEAELRAAGWDKRTVAKLMLALFDEETKVTAAKDYESVHASAPAAVREILESVATRAAPSLKFE